MNKENCIHLEGEPAPIFICPQCVESGYQIDPRINTPDYPVLISTCRTHRICNGEYESLTTSELTDE